jgi:hypothetical protein
MSGNVAFRVFWRDGHPALCALDDNGDGIRFDNGFLRSGSAVVFILFNRPRQRPPRVAMASASAAQIYTHTASQIQDLIVRE